MSIKYLKILIVIISIFPLIIQTGCELPEETEPELPPYTWETGMWFVGKLNTGGDARYVKGAFINGIQYAFLADGQKGLEIIDISNPGNPSLAYNYITNGYVREVNIDSISSNKYAFLSDENNGLYILNITNPSSAYLDTLLSYPGGVNSSFLKNGYLYVALRQNQIKILNLNSLPDSVYEVGNYIPQYIVNHIEVSGSIAYLLQNNMGFELVDISNPASPVYRSGFNTSGSCNDIKIDDNLAYIANGSAGLCVMNISNPSQPYLVSAVNTESDIRGLDYTPNFILTAEYNMGTEVFNTFNPIYPEAFGYYETLGYCFGVHFFKNKALVANGQHGLLILRF